MKKLLLTTTALFVAAPASAATFIVDAFDNSASGGVGVSTFAVSAGDVITISSSSDDLWSAGALPRFSDAGGLVADRFATATDDSGQAVGTLIGADFGNLNQLGLSTAFGSLVGRINGEYQLLGANFSGAAWQDGTLELFYWDSNQGDNFGDISFEITAVPEPATWAFMILGFGAVGGAMRRHKKATVKLSYA